VDLLSKWDQKIKNFQSFWPISAIATINRGCEKSEVVGTIDNGQLLDFTISLWYAYFRFVQQTLNNSKKKEKYIFLKLIRIIHLNFSQIKLAYSHNHLKKQESLIMKLY